MQNQYWIENWQLKSVNAFMDIRGIDAGAEMLADFEKHGSLGKAMINIICQRANLTY